jgi:hypothetical protein
MDHMMKMSESEIAYWVAFLKDINKKENEAPKPKPQPRRLR